MTKDTPTVPDPITAISLLGNRLPIMPLTAAPINGKTGTSQRMLNASMMIGYATTIATNCCDRRLRIRDSETLQSPKPDPQRLPQQRQPRQRKQKSDH